MHNDVRYRISAVRFIAVCCGWTIHPIALAKVSKKWIGSNVPGTLYKLRRHHWHSDSSLAGWKLRCFNVVTTRQRSRHNFYYKTAWNINTVTELNWTEHDGTTYNFQPPTPTLSATIHNITDRETDRWTDRQTDKQTNKQTMMCASGQTWSVENHPTKASCTSRLWNQCFWLASFKPMSSS